MEATALAISRWSQKTFAGPLAGGTSTTSSDSAYSTHGGTQFFKDRLILVCKTIACIDVIYFALFTVALSLDSKASFWTLVAESFSLETLGEYLLLGAVWAACRVGSFGTRALRVIDATLLLGLGLLWSSWCFIHPYPALGAYEMVLALVAAPILRAVLVPSTGIRTLVLTAATCAPGLAASFIAARMRHLTMMTPATLSVLVLNWCSISVIFSTVASSVIYGLRSQVREARRLGQYTLLAKIGEGGMGVVYLARHALLRRRTVVKLLAEDRSTPQAFDRFEREVQLTSQLTHPNTIAIYDFGRTEDGAFYYAMEYLDGMDLENVVAASGPCSPARVIHLIRQVCGALEEAHARGLLHRDIKPSNIFLCPRRGPTDVIKVLDFGLVKDLSDMSQPATLTQAGTLLGTPLYMSPELISGAAEIDGRSDIYALGAVAYYLLCGEPLFRGQTAIEVCCQHLYTAPQPPSLRSGQQVPADLERIVLRCLEKDPGARYPDARSLRLALDACADAARWTEDDALDWWSAHDEQLRAARLALESVETAPTIVVDLQERWSYARC